MDLKDRLVEKVEEEFRDESIERQFVAYAVRSNPVVASLVQKDWFGDVAFGEIVGLVRELGITFTKASLLRELKDRKIYPKSEKGIYGIAVDEIFSAKLGVLNERNIRQLATQIFRMAESRRVIEGVGEILTNLDEFDLDKAKESLRGLGKRISLSDSSREGYYIDDYRGRVSVIRERQEKEQEGEETVPGIPIGIYRFDQLTGGLMPGEFGVIAGMSGVGKTAGLLCFGIHAWRLGRNVMIVSGEMSKELLEFRIDSNLTGISGDKFRKAGLDKNDFTVWDQTVRTVGVTGGVLFVKAYTRHFNMEMVEEDILRVQEDRGAKIDLLCLDYLNIMSSNNKTKVSNRDWTSQADVVWDVKGVAGDLELVCWTAAQVRDDAFSKELYDQSDVKYARAITETAPVVIALIQDEKDALENRMKLQVLKMRNSRKIVRPILLNPNLELMRIHEELKVGTVKSLADLKPETVERGKRVSRYSGRSNKYRRGRQEEEE